MQTTTEVFEDLRQNVRFDALKPSEKNLEIWSSDFPHLPGYFHMLMKTMWYDQKAPEQSQEIYQHYIVIVIQDYMLS